MAQITEDLYLGNRMAAENLDFLTTKKITHIVNVAEEVNPKFASIFKILHIKVKDEDSFPYLDHFEEITDYINDAIAVQKGKVYVHCYYGVNRSASAVIAYFIKYHKMTFQAAWDFTKEKKMNISPSNGFCQQLMMFADICNGKLDKSAIKNAPIFSKPKPQPTPSFESIWGDWDKPVIKENIVEESKTVETSRSNTQFFCKKCESYSFHEGELLSHCIVNENCDYYFLKEHPSTGKINLETEKLLCFNEKCKVELGVENMEGIDCACKSLIISKYAIDKSRIMKRVI